nr:reverse transcriptase domain-containing protein [Tanacetum cinerariifolium]
MQTRSSSRLVSNPSSNPTSSTNPYPKGRNHRRSKQRNEEFNLEELSPPIVMMADQRIMAQFLQAPTEGYKDAIIFLAITADNFELKHGLLTLVQNKQFFGHDKEDLHARIRYFNKITSTLKFPNVWNPRAIISDRGTHFCNDQFAKVMLKYGVTRRLATAYHPQTSGQVEVSNHGLKRILERTMGNLKTCWSGPFTITQVFPYGTVELSQTDGPNF